MTSLPLFGHDPGAPVGVALRDRWRTPAGVLAAPLALLGRERYDLDAAAEKGAHAAARYITVEDDALRGQWGRRAMLVDAPIPLAWLNPPFSPAAGGKARWIGVARQEAASGLLVALYLPVYGDPDVAALDGEALVRIGMVGRVRHLPPPGLEESSPDRTAHAIWLLGPDCTAHLAQPPLAWDWQRRSWVGRRPRGDRLGEDVAGATERV